MDDMEAVVGHYESIREEDRITVGLGQLELVRSRQILRRHLPQPPAKILDVGGGTGVHASWLAEDGYAVHLIDITPRHIEKVVAELGPYGVTAELGDARELPVADDTFDGLVRRFLFDPAFKAVVEHDLKEGQHRNPENRAHWFTTAFFHRPDELRAEAEEAGLEVLEVLGVEGLAGWLPELRPYWDTEEGKATILHSAQAIESEPALLGVSAHLLLVARATG